MIAPTGTPLGSLALGSSAGLFAIAAVNRLFGCAALRPQSGVHSSPSQSMHFAGGASVLPSHHTSPSGSSATLVKIVSCDMQRIAFGLVCSLVPGTTPKYPASGLIARSLHDSTSTHIQTMSSPTVVILQPAS